MQIYQNMQTWAQIFKNKNFSIANLSTYNQPQDQTKDSQKRATEPETNINIHQLIDEDNSVKSMMPKNLRSSPPGSTPIYSLENSDKKDMRDDLVSTFTLQDQPRIQTDVPEHKMDEETPKTTAESKEVEFLGEAAAR